MQAYKLRDAREIDPSMTACKYKLAYTHIQYTIFLSLVIIIQKICEDNMKQTNSNIRNCSLALGRARERMIKDGAYDGRFRSRTYIDRKKEQSRRGCKNWQ